MLAELNAACSALGRALDEFEPARLSGADCAHTVDLLARIEKRCAAARVVAAARAADCGAHRDRGFSDPRAWLAHASGISSADAKAALETAKGLDNCPQTQAALCSGELSLAQAAEITKTEAAVPGSEADLLELAGRAGVGALREAARTRRLHAQDADELYQRQRRARYLRHWQDDQGMIHISGSFTPDVGVRVVNRLDTETDRLFRSASREGNTEPRECLAADALVKLVMGDGEGKASRADLVLVCDISAFQRGHSHPDEVCHVIGGGPVPVSVAQDLAQRAFIKAVLHDGEAITTVAHFGRHISAKLRTALGLGAPPLFDGAVCGEEGCGRRYHLEWDHRDPVAHLGPTSMDNLGPLCHPCHKEKTRRDREAGLLKPRPPSPKPDGCEMRPDFETSPPA